VRKRLTRDEIAAIFLADGMQKTIAFAFGISNPHVSRIKSHEAHPEITRPLGPAAPLNAQLITLACVPEAV
jgi:hypothetical protein